MKAYQGNDPFIFVSYAHDDRDIVFPIIELLQNNGYHVWYDEGLHIGNDWRDELADMIQQCAAFIYMWSRKSAKSGYCKDEIYAADSVLKERMSNVEQSEDMPFLSVKLEEADLPSGIRMIINPKQMISGIEASAKDIVQQIIDSKKLEACRNQFRYIEGENWGPARRGYYFDDIIDHTVFNSVIDNPIYGDERHFLEIKRLSGMSLQTEDHFIEVQPGNTYIVRITYCNDAAESLNSTNAYDVIAFKVKISVDLPYLLEKGKPEILQANISCERAEHLKVWDQIALYCPSDAIIDFESATAKIYNYGKLSGKVLGTQLFGEGIYIGVHKFNGIIPGGMQYSGSIEFQFTVKPINTVILRRTVSVDSKNYTDRISVLPGDILTFRIYMKNEHYDDIIDVTFRDELPEGLTLIPDTTIIYAVPNVQGRKLSDRIAKNGINTGLFGAGITGVIQYKAQVSKDFSEPIELVTKSHLYFTTMRRNEVNRFGKVPDRTISMCSEATCYVQPAT